MMELITLPFKRTSKDFSIVKAHKLHQSRCKTSPFDALAEGRLRTKHSDSEQGGPRIQSVTVTMCHTSHLDS